MNFVSKPKELCQNQSLANSWLYLAIASVMQAKISLNSDIDDIADCTDLKCGHLLTHKLYDNYNVD